MDADSLHTRTILSENVFSPYLCQIFHLKLFYVPADQLANDAN